MESVVVILAIIVGVVTIALVRERRRAPEKLDRSEFDHALSEMNAARIRVGQLEEAERRLEQRVAELAEERDAARTSHEDLQRQLLVAREELQGVRSADEARQAALEERQKELDTHFRGIASEVAHASNEEFRKQAAEEFKRQRQLADKDMEARQLAVSNLVKPVAKNLDELQKHVQELEVKREGAYKGIDVAVQQAQAQIEALRAETGGLKESLRTPNVRGFWGEKTLESMLELAGLRRGETFWTQQSERTEGGTVRPDVIVKMPGDKRIVIDSKMPAARYLDAREAKDEETEVVILHDHAQAVIDRAQELQSKSYHQVDGSLDFVIMFVGADAILDAALRVEPGLWERSWRDYRVLIASPAVLIAILNGVAEALRQEDEYRNAQEIASSGRELYDRLSTYADHVQKLGRSLNSAVNHYNASVGSIQRSVLPSARRMKELRAVPDSVTLKEPDALEARAEEITRPELVPTAGEDGD
ncbi:MAG: DNA recombination protein RmuC [Chloroflexota bacterium]|nr:DNA recombination protein RmuC [Chloroflexota bacterium]